MEHDHLKFTLNGECPFNGYLMFCFLDLIVYKMSHHLNVDTLLNLVLLWTHQYVTTS